MKPLVRVVSRKASTNDTNHLTSLTRRQEQRGSAALFERGCCDACVETLRRIAKRRAAPMMHDLLKPKTGQLIATMQCYVIDTPKHGTLSMTNVPKIFDQIVTRKKTGERNSRPFLSMPCYSEPRSPRTYGKPNAAGAPIRLRIAAREPMIKTTMVSAYGSISKKNCRLRS